MFEMYQGGQAVIVMASFFCVRSCWPMSGGEEMLVREDWLVGGALYTCDDSQL